ncbi:MAG: hypothetical protein ACK55I_09830, partial [bacterium]
VLQLMANQHRIVHVPARQCDRPALVTPQHLAPLPADHRGQRVALHPIPAQLAVPAHARARLPAHLGVVHRRPRRRLQRHPAAKIRRAPGALLHHPPRGQQRHAHGASRHPEGAPGRHHS